MSQKDNIWKDKLGGFQPEFREDDWKAMEAMLDNEPGGRVVAWRWPLLLLLLLSLGGLGSWALISNGNGKAEQRASEMLALASDTENHRSDSHPAGVKGTDNAAGMAGLQASGKQNGDDTADWTVRDSDPLGTEKAVSAAGGNGLPPGSGNESVGGNADPADDNWYPGMDEDRQEKKKDKQQKKSLKKQQKAEQAAEKAAGSGTVNDAGEAAGKSKAIGNAKQEAAAAQQAGKDGQATKSKKEKLIGNAPGQSQREGSVYETEDYYIADVKEDRNRRRERPYEATLRIRKKEFKREEISLETPIGKLEAESQSEPDGETDISKLKFSQPNYFQLGAEVGYNLAGIRLNNPGQGMHIGLSATYVLKDRIGIGTGLRFTHTAHNVSFDDNDFPDLPFDLKINSYESQLQSLQIPLNLKVYLNKAKKVRFYAAVEFTVDIRLKETTGGMDISVFGQGGGQPIDPSVALIGYSNGGFEDLTTNSPSGISFDQVFAGAEANRTDNALSFAQDGRLYHVLHPVHNAWFGMRMMAGTEVSLGKRLSFTGEVDYGFTFTDNFLTGQKPKRIGVTTGIRFRF